MPIYEIYIKAENQTLGSSFFIETASEQEAISEGDRRLDKINEAYEALRSVIKECCLQPGLVLWPAPFGKPMELHVPDVEGGTVVREITDPGDVTRFHRTKAKLTISSKS